MPQLAHRDEDLLGVPVIEGPDIQRLPTGWLVGRDCDIGGPPGHSVRVNLVVLHPAFGVALLGFSKFVEYADDILRQRLAEAQFGDMFGGHLPILNGAVEFQELPKLVPLLVEAFGAESPLELTGGDAWVSAVTRLVVPANRSWGDSLQGVFPALAKSPLEEAEEARSTWRSTPAEVVPLRQITEARPEEDETEAEENLPPSDARPVARRRWPWAAGTLVSAFAVVVALEFSYTEDPAPDGRSSEVEAAIPMSVPGMTRVAVEPETPALSLATGADVSSVPVGSAPTPLASPPAVSNPVQAASVPSRPVAARPVAAAPHAVKKLSAATAKPVRVHAVKKATPAASATSGRHLAVSRRTRING